MVGWSRLRILSHLYVQVCKSLHLIEKDYFGLQYRDKNGDHLWVNLRNPLYEQVSHGPRPLLEMRVKFFVQPQKLMQSVTRSVSLVEPSVGNKKQFAFVEAIMCCVGIKSLLDQWLSS